MDRGRPCGKLLTSHLARNLRRHSRRRGSIGRQPMARVFLADCQPLFNEALEALIARDGRNEVVGQACTASQVSESVVHLKPDLVVIDADLGLASRPTLVESLLQDLADTKVILLAQDTDIDLLLLAIRSGALGVVGKKSGTQTVLRAVQAVLDGEGVVPRAMLPELFRRLIDLGDRASDTPLSRLSPREREVLALLGRGWSNSRIGDELFISPHTVRTHVQNILQKLEMHSKLEAATFAMQHELPSRRISGDVAKLTSRRRRGAGTVARFPAEGGGEEAEMVPRRPPSGVPSARVSVPRPRIALTGALAVLATAAAVANRQGAGPSAPAAVAGLAVALCAAGFLRLEVRHRDGVERLELFGPVLLVAVFAMPSGLAVLAAALAAALLEGLRRVPPPNGAFTVARWSCAAGAGSLTFAALREGFSLAPRNLLALSAAFVAAWEWTPLVTPLFLLPLGLVHWAASVYSAVRADQGRLAGMQRATHALSVAIDPREAMPEFLTEARRCFEAEAVDLVVVQRERRRLWRSRAGIAEGIAALDPDGTVTSWNPGFESITGYRADEVIGTRGLARLRPRDLAGQEVRLERWASAPEALPTILEVLNPTGERCWISCSYARVPDVGGPPRRLVLTSRDVTKELELQRAEQALRERAARFQALVQNSSHMVVVLDAGGGITYASPAFWRLLGHRDRAQVGQGLFDLVHPDDLQALRARFGEHITGAGQTASYEFRCLAGDGTWRHLEALASNLLEDPAVRGVVFNTRDVSERKHAEGLLAGQAAVLDLIARDAPLMETLSALARLVENEAEGARCAVLLLDPEGEALTVAAAPSLVDTGLHEADGMVVGPRAGSSGTAVHRRAPVLVADVAADPLWAETRQVALARGLRAAWAMPITTVESRQVLGTVSIYFDRPRRPGQRDTRLLVAAAHLADIAIQRSQAQARLAHQAAHDALTGLPNRVFFLDRAAHALDSTKRSHSWVAVLFCDLDRFKVINDSLGHDAGDKLLGELGRRLQEVVRPGDTVARF